MTLATAHAIAPPMTDDATPAWTIDLDRRTARHRSGDEYGFERTDGQWSATPLDKADHRRAADALDEWLAEMAAAQNLLRRAGRLLFGESWKEPLSDAIKKFNVEGPTRETIRFWMNGKTPITLSHPVFETLAEMIFADMAPLLAVAQEIKREHKSRPAATGKRFTSRLSPKEDPAVPGSPARGPAP